MGINILAQLEQKAEFVDWHKDTRQTVYILFSINGFSVDLQAVASARHDVILV